MKYANNTKLVQNEQGVKLIIEADNLLSYENLLNVMLEGVKEQLNLPYCDGTNRTIKEVLEEDNRPQQ